METYGRARQSTDDNTIRRVCFACWITKAANIHLEYVMLVTHPRQKLLRDRSSLLRYTFIYCLVLGTSKVLCIEELIVASRGIMFMLSSCLVGSVYRADMGFALRCGLQSRLPWQ